MWWVEALTNNSQRLESFYGGLFQWRFDRQSLSPHPVYITSALGSEAVAGFLPMGPDWGVTPRWQVIFEVEDLERSTEQVLTAGGRVEVGPLDVPRAGRLTSVRDPQGALFVLIEPRRA